MTLDNFLTIWSIASDGGIFLVALYIAYLAGGFKNQLYNHIPSDIKELKEGQKALEQKVDQNYKDLSEQNNQNYKDLSEQNNQNFQELVRLIVQQDRSD